MAHFRALLCVLAVLVTGLFLLAQILTTYVVDATTFTIRPVQMCDFRIESRN
jgi:hypothetical protein